MYFDYHPKSIFLQGGDDFMQGKTACKKVHFFEHIRCISEVGQGKHAPRKGACFQFTSSTAKRSPFPSRGRTIARFKMGLTCNVGRDTYKLRRAKRCRAGPGTNTPIHEHRRGEAHRRHWHGCRPPCGSAGWVGGACPSAQIQGADTGFRRTAYLHPRRAKRKAQVCGEITVGSVGQEKNASRRGAGLQFTSSTAKRSPFPSRGRTIARFIWA